MTYDGKQKYEKKGAVLTEYSKKNSVSSEGSNQTLEQTVNGIIANVFEDFQKVCQVFRTI